MRRKLGIAALSVVGACTFAWVASIGCANPLDDHRRAAHGPSKPAYVVTSAIASASSDGRIVFSIPSARLLSAGVFSGDEVAIDFGGAFTTTAYVQFRDEIDRNIRFYADQGLVMDVVPGMTLVVDRDHPGERVVLDATTGGIDVRDVSLGRPISIQAVRRIPGP